MSDDVVSGVRISTSSDVMCVAILGFGDDNWSTVVSVKRGSPVTLSGSDRWRCKTVGNQGENCSGDHPMEMFTPDIVAATMSTTVSALGSDETGNFVSDLTIPDFPGLFDLSGIKDTVIAVLIAVAVLSVVIVVVVVVVRIVRKRKKKQQLDEFLEA
jgi:hypothetical protein